MKIKNLFFITLISLIIIILGTTNSQAYLDLNSLDFEVQLKEDGSMDVTENWNIYIDETNTLYKTFPIDKEKYSGLTNFSVQEITAGRAKTFSRSSTWQYHLTKDYYFGGINNEGDYEISWGVGLDNSSDTRQYKISYTVLDAVKKYGDCAELYWQFVGPEFEVDANKITGTIKLPQNAKNKEEIKVWGHTEYLNGEIYVTDTDTVEFKLNNYRSGHFVEVRLAMPTYMFEALNFTTRSNVLENIIEEETIWAEEANAKREARDNMVKTFSIIGSAIIAAVGGLFSFKIKKYKQELEETPKIVPQNKLDYYREVPDETATPVEASFVLNKMQDISQTLSATILNLTLKGALNAEQQDKKIIFEITGKEVSLEKDEQAVLDLLEKAQASASKKIEDDKKTITTKELEKYIKNHPSKFESLKNKFDKISKDRAVEKGKFDKQREKKSEDYIGKTVGYVFLAIAAFAAMVVLIMNASGIMNSIIKYIVLAAGFTILISIINLVMCGMLASRFNGFTQKGENEREEWKAFKKYMEDFSLLNEREVPELVLWEKFLVYATAFGIAEKVIKQLKIKFPELNDPNNINSNLVLFSMMSGPHGLNTNFISSMNTSTTHMYSSTYSSGSGGGGGFSGGGGFGGRRWPEAADVKLNKIHKVSLENRLTLLYNIFKCF